MEKKDFARCMIYLGTAYAKEFSKKEVELYYEFLKGYSFDIVSQAIKNLIMTTRYLPKVNELIEECEKMKYQEQNNIIERLKEEGYFKELREYEKAINFYNEGIIPSWLLEEMNKYMCNQLNYKENKKLL